MKYTFDKKKLWEKKTSQLFTAEHNYNTTTIINNNNNDDDHHHHHQNSNIVYWANKITIYPLRHFILYTHNYGIFLNTASIKGHSHCSGKPSGSISQLRAYIIRTGVWPAPTLNWENRCVPYTANYGILSFCSSVNGPQVKVSQY